MGLNCNMKNLSEKTNFETKTIFLWDFFIGYKKYSFEERKSLIINKVLNGLVKVVQKQVGLLCPLTICFTFSSYLYIYLMLRFGSVFWNFGYIFLIMLNKFDSGVTFCKVTKHVFLKITFRLVIFF